MEQLEQKLRSNKNEFSYDARHNFRQERNKAQTPMMTVLEIKCIVMQLMWMGFHFLLQHWSGSSVLKTVFRNAVLLIILCSQSFKKVSWRMVSRTNSSRISCFPIQKSLRWYLA